MSGERAVKKNGDEVVTAGKSRVISLLPRRIKRRISRYHRVRTAVLARDGSRCRYCGRAAKTVDHVKPKCQGGRHSMDNCVACCFKCNKRKGPRTPEQAGMTLLPARSAA